MNDSFINFRGADKNEVDNGDDISKQRTSGGDSFFVNESLNITSKFAVADIHLGFNNKKMIDQLKKRGEAIGEYKFDEVTKIEKEINTKLLDDKKEIAEMIKPCYAFITFKKIDGVKEALIMSKKRTWKPCSSHTFNRFTLYDEECFFQQAESP